jgi:hypothetical protein
MICAHCNQRCNSNGSDMIDPDGAPHRLTCQVTNRQRVTATRRMFCNRCRCETTFTIAKDRHSELQRCCTCRTGQDVRPISAAPQRR